ncbi:hypothetical protein [Kamptonema formosum]|nr:hypothetical protein [Oscillatoria sp. PCC 10802]
MGIPISELVGVRKGGKPELQGTWTLCRRQSQLGVLKYIAYALALEV